MQELNTDICITVDIMGRIYLYLELFVSVMLVLLIVLLLINLVLKVVRKNPYCGTHLF